MFEKFQNANICRVRILLFEFLFQVLKGLLAHCQPFFNQFFQLVWVVLLKTCVALLLRLWRWKVDKQIDPTFVRSNLTNFSFLRSSSFSLILFDNSSTLSSILIVLQDLNLRRAIYRISDRFTGPHFGRKSGEYFKSFVCLNFVLHLFPAVVCFVYFFGRKGVFYFYLTVLFRPI